MDIHQRLAEFVRRLKAAPPACDANEALALVCRLIEEVEDEFCPLPRETPPPGLRFTGRMYAPQKDRIRRINNGVLMAATRRHLIYCYADGAIQIERVHDNTTVLRKEGKQ